MKWLHKLRHPHCEHCREEAREDRVCDSCDTLRAENMTLRYQNEQLIKSLLSQFGPREVIVQPQEVDIKPVTTTGVSWRIRQQFLEAEDRAAAKIKRENAQVKVEGLKSTEQLENELLHGDEKVNNG